MRNFNRAFVTLIEHEGYYANVEGDRGGETYMGIARNIHHTWRGWEVIDTYKKNACKRELPNNYRIDSVKLDKLVKDFYYRTFWLRHSLDKISDYNLQYIIFDWCVNSGVYGAKHVQKLVGATPDGIIGTVTVGLINGFEPLRLFEIIKKRRITYYNQIAKIGQNAKFLSNWLSRINSINYINT